MPVGSRGFCLRPFFIDATLQLALGWVGVGCQYCLAGFCHLLPLIDIDQATWIDIQDAFPELEVDVQDKNLKLVTCEAGARLHLV